MNTQKKFFVSLIILILSLILNSHTNHINSTFPTLSFPITQAFEDWGIKDVESSEKNSNGEIVPKVYLSHEFLEKDILKITASLSDVNTPLIGTAFHLLFDKEKLEFLKYNPLNFFEQGGDPLYLTTAKANKIIFGATLKREDIFPLGQGDIAEFYFQILKPKPYFFSFENGVLSGMDTVMQDILEVNWEDYEISDNQSEKSSVQINIDSKNSKILTIFSWKNILIAILPTSAVFISLWTYYFYKIKPVLNNTSLE